MNTFSRETEEQTDHMVLSSIKVAAEGVHYCLNDYNSVNAKLVCGKL